jgi:hypothetical protein
MCIEGGHIRDALPPSREGYLNPAIIPSDAKALLVPTCENCWRKRTGRGGIRRLGTDVPHQQEQAGDGEPEAVVLEQSSETAPHSPPRLCLPPEPARSRTDMAPRRAPELLPSPKRKKAEPRCLGSAPSPSCGDRLPLREPPNSASTSKFDHSCQDWSCSRGLGRGTICLGLLQQAGCSSKEIHRSIRRAPTSTSAWNSVHGLKVATPATGIPNPNCNCPVDALRYSMAQVCPLERVSRRRT